MNLKNFGLEKGAANTAVPCKTVLSQKASLQVLGASEQD